jgi:hypothetical protein
MRHTLTLVRPAPKLNSKYDGLKHAFRCKQPTWDSTESEFHW